MEIFLIQHIMKVKMKLWSISVSVYHYQRHQYIKRCKEALWKRWKHEYLVVLRKKHNLKHKDKSFKINVGDVMMIKREEKNRGHWKIGTINHLYVAKNNIIWVAQLSIAKKLIDRPIQLLYPLELHRESITTTNRDEKKNELNSSATECCPKRTVAEIAKWRKGHCHWGRWWWHLIMLSIMGGVYVAM